MTFAPNQRQMGTDTERGFTRGVAYPFAPAVVHDNAQEGAMASPSRCAVISSLVKLGGAVKSPVPFTRIPDRRAVTPPAAAVSGACGLLHHASRTHSYGARLQPRSIIRATGSNRSRAHTCPMKPASQFFAYRDFLLHFGVLSFVRLDRFKPSEASNGRVPKPTRAFHRNEGELPNVCG